MHLFPLRLRKRVDSQRLHMAWETVVQSSSILRTSFHYLVNLGSWAQATHSAADLKWSEEEVSSIAGVASQWYKGLVSSFNWDDDAKCIHRPPLYLHLVKGPDISLVLVAIHHALYDGVSITRLFETVQDVYDGREVDTTPSFKDLLPHILWQERHGTEYFLQLLEGTERKPIPRTGSSSDLTFLDTHEIIIEDELLEQTRVRAGVTLQCLGQTAFAQLLSILTKSNDIVFGHVVSGRSLPGAEDVLGPVLVRLTLRLHLESYYSAFGRAQFLSASS